MMAAACREAGLNLPVLDAVGERIGLDETLSKIRSHQPPVVVVYCSWGTLESDCEAIGAIRRAFRTLPIIAVGAGIRFSCEELLLAGATHVLLGDPDLALARFLTLASPRPGIHRVRDLMPEAHNHAGLLRDPSLLPRPAWDTVPWQHYGFLTLFGARGCDDTCRYCAYITVQGRAYRPRPAQDVIDEMLWLARTYRPRRIMVRDPVFAHDRSRAMAIARGLAAVRFDTPWECESRPEHFDAALLRQMAKAGCTVIKLGIETADAELLVRLGRIANPAEARHYLAYTARVIADARRYGIITRAFVMVGLPGQTTESVEATAAYLRRVRPAYVHARPYVAYPRVPLGPAQTSDRTQALLPPLQAVADECQVRSTRPPSLQQRVRRRLTRLWLTYT
ncbi:MAG: radical SAM protein [Caldilineae bacterium]|nr:MAG: radical SAM protein [Caldilineae bacterium]